MTTLVTGGLGFIGAWTLYHLVQDGEDVICFDLDTSRHRLDMLLTRAEQSTIRFIQGDITDPAQVEAAMQGADAVIHFSALQVPACRANPILGSQVNVTGTVNVFEAALKHGIGHVTYASSIAVYGSADAYATPILPDDAPRLPQTLYGVYKVCNEDTARVYYADHGLTSAALRPYTVFGVGRDQGLTSEPTKAMLAAARGEDYAISFGGRMQFQWGSDIARQFITLTRQPRDGAFAFNPGDAPVAVAEVAAMMMQARPGVTIRTGEATLPFPPGLRGDSLREHFPDLPQTPLAEAVRQTIEHFARTGA